ncbi:uncharacterized protein L201_000554 [Kwoniella dendrophila CBS 6074]|uniref:Ubiquitin-like protease family profile domain-containing protein n=1 Tax=Kwoniella dendrophila CBS 6074 TaxID=1295534 RepID=A0AAX4JLH4_9TREE
MSSTTLKRTSSSLSSRDYQDNRGKRIKTSPEKSLPTGGKHTAKQQQPGILGKMGRVVSNFLNITPSSSQSSSSNLRSNNIPSSSQSSGTSDIDSVLQPHSGGSLALYNSYDQPTASGSSIQTLVDGYAGLSKENPVDITDDDDKSITEIIPPSRLIAQAAAASSSQNTPQIYPSLPNNQNQDLLFPESFSNRKPQSNNQLPTPANSQEDLEISQTSSNHQYLNKRNSQNESTALNHVNDRNHASSSTTNHQSEIIKLASFSHHTLKKQLSRPDVRLQTPPQTKKGWEFPRNSRSPSSSSTGSNRSYSRRDRKDRKFRSNIRSQQDIVSRRLSNYFKLISEASDQQGDERAGASARRVAKMFSGEVKSAGPAAEIAMKYFSRNGKDSKEAYRALMGVVAPKQTTLEDKTTPSTPVFSVSNKKVISQKAKQKAANFSAFKFEDQLKVLKGIQEEDEKKEREIEAKLKKPKVPTSLSPDQEAKVSNDLNDPRFTARIPKAQCDAKNIRRLKPTTWLDDEIMNFYGEMMVERSKSIGRKIHFFNSFFYQKLSENGYDSVKRWGKKFNLFDMAAIVFPVNIGNMHWTACAINLEKKRIEYYDSMGDYSGHRHNVFKCVREYLKQEHQLRKGTPFDFTGWEDDFNEKTPQQNNGSDCGVFSCQTLEMITRGRDTKKGFEFDASSMSFFRRLMVWEIGNGKLEPRTWGNPSV